MGIRDSPLTVMSGVYPLLREANGFNFGHLTSQSYCDIVCHSVSFPLPLSCCPTKHNTIHSPSLGFCVFHTVLLPLHAGSGPLSGGNSSNQGHPCVKMPCGHIPFWNNDITLLWSAVTTPPLHLWCFFTSKCQHLERCDTARFPWLPHTWLWLSHLYLSLEVSQTRVVVTTPSAGPIFASPFLIHTHIQVVFIHFPQWQLPNPSNHDLWFSSCTSINGTFIFPFAQSTAILSQQGYGTPPYFQHPQEAFL